MLPIFNLRHASLYETIVRAMRIKFKVLTVATPVSGSANETLVPWYRKG
jgi:hypothetical protein